MLVVASLYVHVSLPIRVRAEVIRSSRSISSRPSLRWIRPAVRWSLVHIRGGLEGEGAFRTIEMRVAAKLESPEGIGVVRLPAESLLEGLLLIVPVGVFVGVVGTGRVRRERPSDGLGDGWRRREVGTLRVEAVLIGRVFDGDGGAVGRGVRVSALDHLRSD